MGIGVVQIHGEGAAWLAKEFDRDLMHGDGDYWIESDTEASVRVDCRLPALYELEFCPGCGAEMHWRIESGTWIDGPDGWPVIHVWGNYSNGDVAVAEADAIQLKGRP